MRQLDPGATGQPGLPFTDSHTVDAGQLSLLDHPNPHD